MGSYTVVGAGLCYRAALLRKSPSTQALDITKYSIVTNSSDSLTLRLMTGHDLAMLYEWLNDLISSSGGAEKKHARHLLTYRNDAPSVLAQESVLRFTLQC